MAVKCLSLNLFLIGFLNIVKSYQHIKACTLLGYESFGRFSDGVWKFEANIGWVTSLLEKEFYFLPPRSWVLIMTSLLLNGKKLLNYQCPSCFQCSTIPVVLEMHIHLSCCLQCLMKLTSICNKINFKFDSYSFFCVLSYLLSLKEKWIDLINF